MDPLREETRKTYIKSFLYAAILTFVFATLYNTSIYTIARYHGATDKQANEIVYTYDIKKQIHTLKNSPGPSDNILSDTNTQPVENLMFDDNNTPVMVIVYRITCNDCKDAYPYIKKEYEKIKQKLYAKNIWWVASRSEHGKTIVDKYKVQFVPTIVYKDRNGDIEKYVLYDDNGTKINLIKEIFETFQLENTIIEKRIK